MKYALAPLAFTLGASAAALKRSQCCFDITASGGASGTVGQLSDGQNRIGGGYSPTSFCLNNGGITDSNGRGCIVTSASGQFQCDEGKAPTTGFSVGGNGTLVYDGKAQFYGCPAADGEDNIYTRPVQGQDKCVPVMLSTGGQCSSSSGGQGTPSGSVPYSTPVASGPVGTPYQTPYTPAYSYGTPAYSYGSPAYSQPAGSSPAYSAPGASSPGEETSPAPEASQPDTPVASVPSVATSAGGGATTPVVPIPGTPGTPVIPGTPYTPGTPAGTPGTPSTPGATPANACPTDLAGDFQYPHLIVPVNSSAPSTAYGTQYNGTLSSTTCTTYNFDIPTNYSSSATCTLEFLFPHQEDLETSAFEFSAGSEDGGVEFSRLSAPVDQATAWDSVPDVQSVYGSWAVRPGNGYVLASGACTPGQTFGVKACSKGGLELNYFQDWNPSPIGLFVRRC
ncbi:ubiquitin 3 binding protein But2 C-terminal domain-containing protein [Phyllosticta citrichinensis]|uniref:Ubiquitin 3 binding protein But2 C-terminal domain-containing protein n=1 Tax=Phyllosticta citrichinensis TaxID=1130410 RepID=A0ABR1XLQ2_9PEZI